MLKETKVASKEVINFVSSITRRSSESAVISAIYFFGSFAFLIGRACAVTLFAARIHDNSKNALPYLYNCSASNYGIEVIVSLIYLYL